MTDAALAAAAAATANPGIAEGWLWCPEKGQPVKAGPRGVEPACVVAGECDTAADEHRRLLIEADTDAPLAGALALVLEISAWNPVRTVRNELTRWDECLMCGATGLMGGTLRHTPDCLWNAAQGIAWDLADGPHP